MKYVKFVAYIHVCCARPPDLRYRVQVRMARVNSDANPNPNHNPGSVDRYQLIVARTYDHQRDIRIKLLLT